VTPEGREQDVEDVVDALSRKHGLRVDGEQPRYHIELDEAASRVVGAGGFDDPLRALLVDLVYDGAVRNLALGWQTPDGDLAATAPERFEVGDFLARARENGLTAGRWYRVHAPAGYRCRPRGFA
jgi:hypothetical protein